MNTSLPRVLVTGASGFIGSGLLPRLYQEGFRAVAALRRPSCIAAPECPIVVTGELHGTNDWSLALKEVQVVVHTAARVHVMDDRSPDPLAEFRMTNVEGTLNLARQACEAGVKRFVFISSVKVNGEETPLGAPYAADDSPAPADPYAVSKHEAEQGLKAIGAQGDMEVVIIRPPLVYGPGVKANFQAMMEWLCRGIPLPLGAVHNRRSLVALDNLVDLITTSIRHPAAANQVFLVSDGEDLSTTELLRRMAGALGRPARLLPVPAWALETGAAMLRRRSLSKRLCGSLQLDIDKTRRLLDWSPPVSVNDALAKTARHFLEHRSI